MSTLERIVPPLDLCEKIPEGEFEDSALVWVYGNTQNPDEVFVEPRRYAVDGTHRPAPTLDEVLEGIGGIETWNTVIITRATNGKTNLATSALKRYFKLKGIKISEK